MNQRTVAQTEKAVIPPLTSVSGGILQRKCACGQHTIGGGECEECRSKRVEASFSRATSLQHQGTKRAEPTAVPPIVYDVLRSPGQPLDAGTRAFFEPRFGHDFSQVRVHTDGPAAESARAVNALAYTVGLSIVFGSRQYEPGTTPGKRLMAHELAHAVQQGDRPGSPQTQLKVSKPEDQLEQEADGVAHTIVTKDAAFEQQTVGVSGPRSVTLEEEPIAQSTKEGMAASFHGFQLQLKQNCRISSDRSPVLQRTASFVAGPVHAVNNEAEVVATGIPSGITWPLLNGARSLLPAAAATAIKRPTITGRSTTSGVECWVGTVGNNVGSFDETVLSGGPWTTVTPRANLAARLGLPACAAAGPGNATLTANGIPSDADVAAANRVHENHHAADHQVTFNSTIRNWDILLTAAAASRQIFNGSDPTSCEVALFAAMGGTPDSIASDYANRCNASGAAFHATPAGGPLRASNPTSDASCSTAAVEVRG